MNELFDITPFTKAIDRLRAENVELLAEVARWRTGWRPFGEPIPVGAAGVVAWVEDGGWWRLRRDEG